jgi:hypothetical protein
VYCLHTPGNFQRKPTSDNNILEKTSRLPDFNEMKQKLSGSN